jgi:hypothetical protein
MVYLFMIISLLLIALATATFILSSDLVKSASYTICTVNDAYNNIFQGTPPGVTPSWSGVNNFYQNALLLATNLPNVLPSINSVFSPSGPFSCPFADTIQCTNAGGNASQQTPIFSK